MTYFQNIRWATDSRSFIVGGRDLKGRQGQYQIDAQTGDVIPTAVRGQLSPDGKKMYYRKDVGANLYSFVEQDLASGNEREIIRRENVRGISLSPDGRFIATADNDEAARSSAVLLVPIVGGEPRELLRLSPPQSLGPAPTIAWMPDGGAVLVNKFLNDSSRNELWLVPIAGGQPRQIDVGASQFESGIKVHPDGRQVAYVAGHRKAEVWALENFLAALKASR